MVCFHRNAAEQTKDAPIFVRESIHSFVHFSCTGALAIKLYVAAYVRWTDSRHYIHWIRRTQLVGAARVRAACDRATFPCSMADWNHVCGSRLDLCGPERPVWSIRDIEIFYSDSFSHWCHCVAYHVKWYVPDLLHYRSNKPMRITLTLGSWRTQHWGGCKWGQNAKERRGFVRNGRINIYDDHSNEDFFLKRCKRRVHLQRTMNSNLRWSNDSVNEKMSPFHHVRCDSD